LKQYFDQNALLFPVDTIVGKSLIEEALPLWIV